MEAIGAGIASIFSTIGGGAAAAGTAAAGSGAGLGTALAAGATSAAVGAGLSKLLAPKMPGAKEPTPMPDTSAIEAAKRRSLVQQRQRAGRSSTILSQGDSGTLG